MIRDLFSLREAEIFETFREISDCDFVLIGGYAVNTYTLPRFSVDCDIVVRREDELKRIIKVLLKRGFTKVGSNAEYSGSFLRYEKRLVNNFAVSFDILINDVMDRVSGVRFEAGWIFENSEMRILKGKTVAEEIRLRIIDIDALLVMKIISCRSTDIRDVFMMTPNANDKRWIKSEIGSRVNLKERIEKILERVNSKQFRDGLSEVYGYFDPKVFEKHKKAIADYC